MTSSLIDSLRAAASFAERLQNAELLGSLNKALLDSSELIYTNATLREEILRLRQQVRDLEEKFAFTDNLVFLSGMYHVIDSEGRIGDPFCPACWDSKKLPVRIHWAELTGYYCNVCDSTFAYNHREPDWTPEHIDANYKARPTPRQLATDADAADSK